MAATERRDLERQFAELTESGLLRRLIQLARDEDLGGAPAPGAGGRGGGGGGGGAKGLSGDITSRICIPEEQEGEARIMAREAGMLAGVRVIPQVLQAFAPDVGFEARAADGHAVEAGRLVGRIAGPLRQILAAERTLLNFLGRLSGVATLTAAFVAAAREGAEAAGVTPPKVLDTRKTTPGMRVVEKYAVACGGGTCHRMGLHDAVLIKDNHIAHVPPGGLAAFLSDAAARGRAARAAFIEAEVDSLDQLGVILKAGGCNLDIVLLDNMAPDSLREAVRMRGASGVKVQLEASGGVSMATIGFIAATGVDRISVGGLTHSARCLDVGLDIEPV